MYTHLNRNANLPLSSPRMSLPNRGCGGRRTPCLAVGDTQEGPCYASTTCCGPRDQTATTEDCPPEDLQGSSEETWNSWHTRWGMFKRGTVLSEDEKVQQLFQCCDESLGDAILRGHPDAVTGDEETLLADQETCCHTSPACGSTQ